MASLAHGATHKGIKHSSLRDKRDFDDEENESLRRKALNETHTHRRRGIFCETKKNISTQKKDVSGEFFFSSFLGFY